MTLQGKTALITGAARGIGHAYCRRLAADGAHVIAVDINDPTAGLAGLPGDGAKTGMVCDVSQPEQIEALAATVLKRFGRCDILVNNAAVSSPTNLDNVTLQAWRRIQATNVESILHFALAFTPGMKTAGWGRIINTGSSITLGQSRDLAYRTSKGAVHALTRALANELGDSRITVNAIAPGIVPTEGFKDYAGHAAPGQLTKVTATQTIKRVADPADAANLLGFLASDHADFITGQILHVDGGLTRTGA
ncbi:SDR family NAD(P)-dependent oxidoreductase [Streptomyces sp. NPDC002814]